MAEQVAVVEPRAAAEDAHLLAELRPDERVDHNCGTPLRPLDSESQVVDGLDPRVADLLELLVRKLGFERVHEPCRSLARRVGDDVELDGCLRHRR